MDVAFYYILYFFGYTFEQVHRTFLHTLFIPIIFLIFGIFAYELKVKNRQFGKKHLHLATIFFILSAMSLLHLILDAIFSGNIVPFYPFSEYAIELNLINLFPIEWQDIIMPTIDAILLFFWIFWMEFKLKTRNYF